MDDDLIKYIAHECANEVWCEFMEEEPGNSTEIVEKWILRALESAANAWKADAVALREAGNHHEVCNFTTGVGLSRCGCDWGEAIDAHDKLMQS